MASFGLGCPVACSACRRTPVSWGTPKGAPVCRMKAGAAGPAGTRAQFALQAATGQYFDLGSLGSRTLVIWFRVRIVFDDLTSSQAPSVSTATTALRRVWGPPHWLGEGERTLLCRRKEKKESRSAALGTTPTCPRLRR